MRACACVYVRVRACVYVHENIESKNYMCINVCTFRMEYRFRTAAREKFCEYVAMGTIRDCEVIGSGLFTRDELQELYAAGYIYLFVDRKGSYFKAVV